MLHSVVGPPYRLLLADPPWPYSDGGSGNGRAKDHYPLMKIDDLFAMPVADLMDRDAVLILWATWPQLDNAFRLVSHWGFDYVTGFPWVKTYEPPWADMFGNALMRPTFGTGSWVRGCSEPILIGRKGDAKHPGVPWMGLISQRMEHSRKPDCIHEYAESFPGPWLELFARRRRAGWHVFGNEVESDVSLRQVPSVSVKVSLVSANNIQVRK